MARPRTEQHPDNMFSKGVIHGLGIARTALTELHRRVGPGQRAEMQGSRTAIELAIANERAERGMEPEALELLARIEALKNGDKAAAAKAAAPASGEQRKPMTAAQAEQVMAPKRAARAEVSPDLQAAFAPVPISGPDGEEDPHEADTEAPPAPEGEEETAEEWAEEA